MVRYKRRLIDNGGQICHTMSQVGLQTQRILETINLKLRMIRAFIDRDHEDIPTTVSIFDRCRMTGIVPPMLSAVFKKDIILVPVWQYVLNIDAIIVCCN